MKQDKGVTINFKQEHSGDISSNEIKNSKYSYKLHCPKCYSSRIRKRSTPFIIAIALFVVLLLLQVIFGALSFIMLRVATLPFIRLQMLLLVTTIIWPFVIMATICFAIVGKNRCKSCGHRFLSMCETEQTESQDRFPLRFSLLSALIIFLTIVVGRQLIMMSSGVEYWIVVLNVFMCIVAWFFIFGVFLIYHALVYHFLRKRIKHNLIWATIFVLPVILLCGFLLYDSLRARSIFIFESQPSKKAQRILSHAEMAILPDSATDIQVYTWSSPFSGEEFLSFKASQNDINMFLKESPILLGLECQIYSKERMRLKYPKYYGTKEEHFQFRHDYFNPDPSAPSWYNPEIRGRGKRYEIHPKGYHCPGEVIVDEEENLVFVKLVFS